ncbi:MAG: ATP-binding protein [Gammaproteobacteria bacterium]
MFSLRIKLFLAMLLTSGLLIASLLAFMQWSFRSGFGDFLRQQQQQRLTLAADELAEHFRLTGGWSDVDLRLLRRPLPRPPEAPAHAPHRQPPRTHFFVLNAHRQAAIGRYDPGADNVLEPIRVDDRVVGFVGERVRNGPQDFMERRFAEHQSRHLLFVALLAGLISLVVAYPVASIMVARIQALLAHIRQLSKGELSARTPVKGSDELSQLALHLNSLGQTLQQNAQAHRTLVADISHELRTPIAVLKAQLEAAEDGIQPLNETTLARLQQQVRRLGGLVDDLYQLSLADLGALNYQKALLDVRALTFEVSSGFEAQMARAGLQLIIRDRTGRTLTVLGDHKRLQQLISNLLQNSVQYTNAPGTVRVDIGDDGHHAIIRVADSAPGVPPELQQRLFERLFRTDASRNRNSGGAGLGLSLCQSIVQAHGGQIDISDSDLGGITVTVRLPLATE